MRHFQMLLFCLSVLVSTLVAREQDEIAAYQVDAETMGGVSYQGLVLPPVAGFPTSGAVDLKIRKSDERVTFHGFNGLRGSVTLRVKELRSLSVTGTFDRKQYDAFKKAKKEGRIVVEQKRSGKSADGQSSGGLAGNAVEKGGAAPESEEKRVTWLERFPPEKGWTPRKKYELWRKRVVIGLMGLTVEENTWLENYPSWKVEFDVWLTEGTHEGKLPGGLKASDLADPEDRLPPVKETQQEPVPLKKGVSKPVPLKKEDGR